MSVATKSKKKPGDPGKVPVKRRKRRKDREPYLTRLALSDLEFAGLELIGRKYGHDTASGSLRFALEQQVLRDEAFGTQFCPAEDETTALEALTRIVGQNKESICFKTAAGVRTSVGVGVVRESTEAGQPVVLREWSLWLWDRHFTALDAIMKRWALESRIDAFRMAIRTQAELDGYEPPNGWVKHLENNS